jgi:hypothetical protein
LGLTPNLVKTGLGVNLTETAGHVSRRETVQGNGHDVFTATLTVAQVRVLLDLLPQDAVKYFGYDNLSIVP